MLVAMAAARYHTALNSVNRSVIFIVFFILKFDNCLSNGTNYLFNERTHESSQIMSDKSQNKEYTRTNIRRNILEVEYDSNCPHRNVAFNAVVKDYVGDFNLSFPVNYDDDIYLKVSFSSIYSRNVDSTSNKFLPKGCSFLDNSFESILCAGPTIKQIPLIPVRSVHTLIFQNTRIRYVGKNATRLPKTKTLIFTDGVLAKINGAYLLRAQPQLEELHIVRNKFYILPSFGTDEIENNLKVLNLQDNLTGFPHNQQWIITTVLEKLQYFSVKGNNLKIIPSYYFLSFENSSLKGVSLRDCGLTDFERRHSQTDHASPFRFIRNIEILDMGKNPFLPINKLADMMLPLKDRKLKVLLLSDNNYKSIPKSVIKQVSSTLEVLDLAYSSMSSINSWSFPDLPMLLTLCLQNSRISSITNEAFKGFSSLETLLLSGNLLTTIRPEIRIPSLKFLGIENNPTEDIDGDQNFQLRVPLAMIPNNFSISAKLVALSLRHNKLERLRPLDLHPYNYLEALDLSRCQLQDMQAGAFIRQRSLKYLWLNNNKLKYFSTNLFKGLDSLAYLDISHNNIALYYPYPIYPLNSLYEAVGYKQKNKRTRNMLTRQSKTNDEIDSITQLNNVCYLDLSHNEIRHLSKDAFSSMTGLVTADLSFNRIESWHQSIFSENANLTIINLSYNQVSSFTPVMIDDVCLPNVSIMLSRNTLICSCDIFDIISCRDNIKDYENGTCTFDETKNFFLSEYEAMMDKELCTAKSYSERIMFWYISRILIFSLLIIMLLLLVTCVFTKRKWYIKYLYYKVRIKYYDWNRTMDKEIYEYDFFVSYSQADRQWVFEKLIQKLESTTNGFKVCVHERDFVVGEHITNNIIRSVENSRKVVIVVSKSYIKSSWCMFELNLASSKVLDEQKNKLLILLLERVPQSEQPTRLRELLKRRTYLEWKPNPIDQAVFWEKFKKVSYTKTLTNSNENAVCPSCSDDLDVIKSRYTTIPNNLAPVHSSKKVSSYVTITPNDHSSNANSNKNRTEQKIQKKYLTYTKRLWIKFTNKFY